MDRRAKIAATERAGELLRRIMQLEDRREPLLSAYAKRSTAVLDGCGRHVLIVASLPNSNRSEAEHLRLERECEAIEAALRAYDRLTDRYEQAAARIERQLAKLLEELWLALRPIGARERGRLVAAFNFWLQKNESED